MPRHGSQRDETARTSWTFGPFSSPVRRVALLAALFGAACGAAEGPGTFPGPSGTLPPIAEAPEGGERPAGEEAEEASSLISEARSALERGEIETALAITDRVAEDHPTALGSSEALWIRARAAEAAGSWATAAESAARFRELLPPGHELEARARLLEGGSRIARGEVEAGLQVLLGVRADAPADERVEALDEVRRSASDLSFTVLQSLRASAPNEESGAWAPLGAPILARYAEELYVRGRSDEAREAATAVLERGSEEPADTAAGPEYELARAVLEGRVSRERRGRMVLGALLPESGSPSERQYARLVQEGIRARIESRDPEAPLTVELQVRDDSGSVSALPRILGDLDGLGALGIIGPMTNAMMDAAIDARPGALPLVSPTVQPVPDGVPGVYSLDGLDPGGPELLARFTLSRGLQTAVILHAGSVEHRFEARIFQEEYAARGGTVLRTISYPPGSTFFEEHLGEVQQLRPEALVLPVPLADIELLAPQLTYFGLDTLGVRVFGTEAWGEPDVAEAGDPRHLNGIVVATPRPPGREMPGWEDFVEDYESVHRRTLRSRVPALGYDAAGLLLEAAAVGARDASELRASLESIRDFPGATGYLSLVDGEIRRRYFLVRLREGEIIPLDFDAAVAGIAP